MLRPGEPVPDLTVARVGGGEWDVHRARRSQDYLLLEIYRGRHCPVCAAHLSALAARREELSGHGCALFACSMNERALAEDAVSAWGLGELEVGYGLDEDTARAWGLYLSDRYRDTEPLRFAEPATFVVRADGTLYAADVRSSPHLRPQVDRLVTLVRRAAEGYPPRGAA